MPCFFFFILRVHCVHGYVVAFFSPDLEADPSIRHFLRSGGFHHFFLRSLFSDILPLCFLFFNGSQQQDACDSKDGAGILDLVFPKYLFDTTKEVSVLSCGNKMHLECAKQIEDHYQCSEAGKKPNYPWGCNILSSNCPPKIYECFFVMAGALGGSHTG
ncbi:uncharacterized protein [Spinacia oleracea]|uniref:Uncharacterized protein n=1 Tax=Spinacia oleracea TaxID=3562 RepID=A0ABM3RAD6_SPIOL|nr:uncharacterized protein LOC110777681 [Spinacia oleracea]